MTSDAKIGLLLGLVFIFIIAFIINGLPSLRQSDDGNAMYIDQEPEHSLAARERLVNEGLNDPPVPEAADPPYDIQSFAADNQSFASDIYTTDLIQPIIQDGSASGSEWMMPIPTDQTTDAEFGQILPEDRVIIDVPRPEPEEDVAVELDTGPTEMREVVIQVPDISTNKKHTVAGGETLAAIAKKYYGTEQGNRMVNINRIFEANKGTLESPDKISIGQQLTVPPLAGGVFTTGPADTTTPPKPKPSKPKPKPTNDLDTGKWYVVRDGDCLSQIASKQLGSAKRLEEIAKLNADVLKSKDFVVVGMKLRLPGQ